MQSQVDLAAVFDEHHEHIYWDQASLLVQTGLLDSSKLPVTGAEQSEGFVNGTYATNALIVRTETVLS